MPAGPARAAAAAGTAGAAPAAGERTADSPDGDGQDGSDEAASGSQPRSRRRALVAIGALVAAGLAAVLLPLALDDDAGTTAGTGAATAGAPATNAAPAPPTTVSPLPPPPGWRLHRDPTGFSVAVPIGWREVRDGSLVEFRDPSADRFIRIDQRANPRTDPYDEWVQQQRVVRQRLANYQVERIATVQYRGWPTADWEFTWGRSGMVSHVLNRNFVPNRSRGYALYWSTPEESWDGDKQLFDVFAATFSPARR